MSPRVPRQLKPHELWIMEYRALFIGVGLALIIVGAVLVFLREFGVETPVPGPLICLPTGLGAALSMLPRNLRRQHAAWVGHQQQAAGTPG